MEIKCWMCRAKIIYESSDIEVKRIFSDEEGAGKELRIRSIKCTNCDKNIVLSKYFGPVEE